MVAPAEHKEQKTGIVKHGHSESNVKERECKGPNEFVAVEDTDEK